MLDTSRMVVENLFALLVLCFFITVYRYIYPRKKINLLILLIIISLLPLLSLLRPGDYESGDFNIHIYRSISFYNSLKEGIIMPSWAALLNATYGYPLFIFINPLPYYIVSLFHFIGFSFIASMKLFLASSFITSGIGMYLFVRTIIKNNLAAFTAGIFYLFSPYHLVDLHFRATVGEMLTFAFLPFAFIFIHKFIQKSSTLYFFSATLFLSLIILGHQATAFFSFLFIFIYSLFFQLKRKKITARKMIFIFLIFMVSGLVTLYAWLPYLLLSQYTLSYKLSSHIVSFPNLWELFYSPWRNGFLFQGPKGELSFIIGYSQWIIIVIAIFTIIKHKVQKNYESSLKFWLIIFCIIVFMITPFSKFIWERLPLINIIQFSTRLLVFISFCTAILSGYIIYYLQKNKNFLCIEILLAFALISTILNWGHRRVIPEINDEALMIHLPISTYNGEGLSYIGNSKWWDDSNGLWIRAAPTSSIEILNGEAEIKQILKTSTKHIYFADAKTNVFLKENTTYFPGWKVKSDDREISIDKSHHSYKGIITFYLPQGKWNIEVSYHDIFSLKIAKLVSFISFFLLISILSFILINNHILTIKKLFYSLLS